MKKDRAHKEYNSKGSGKRSGRSLYLLLYLLLSLSVSQFLMSCYYPRPNLEDENISGKMRDSLTYLYERHYTWNTNLEVHADSVNLACLPVKNCYNMLYKGDRVVVAEFVFHV